MEINGNKHSYLAEKLLKKSGMPDNSFWDHVQDTFDHKREERLIGMPPCLGKTFNAIMAHFDWKKAKKEQMHDLLNIIPTNISIEKIEDVSRKKAFDTSVTELEKIGVTIDSNDALAKEDHRVNPPLGEGNPQGSCKATKEHDLANPPLDEENLQDSFRDSAFKMAYAKGGPRIETLEKWRQDGLKFCKKREREKAFWKSIGLD